MTVEVIEETIRIVKIKFEEKEITILLNEEEFRLLEYSAYQLEISVGEYIETVLKTDIREIKRNYGI